MRDYMVTQCDDFLGEIKSLYEKRYAKLKEMSIQIDFNYELDTTDGFDWVDIRKSGYDGVFLRVDKRSLADAMNTISIYTNDELDCGCTFTMGW